MERFPGQFKIPRAYDEWMLQTPPQSETPTQVDTPVEEVEVEDRLPRMEWDDQKGQWSILPLSQDVVIYPTQLDFEELCLPSTTTPMKTLPDSELTKEENCSTASFKENVPQVQELGICKDMPTQGMVDLSQLGKRSLEEDLTLREPEVLQSSVAPTAPKKKRVKKEPIQLNSDQSPVKVCELMDSDISNDLLNVNCNVRTQFRGFGSFRVTEVYYPQLNLTNVYYVFVSDDGIRYSMQNCNNV